MKKSPKHKSKQKTESRELMPKNKNKLLQVPGKAIAIFLAFCTALGILILWPRLTVEPGINADPSGSLPLSFKITNTGFIPLKNVQPGLGICAIYGGVPRVMPERCNKVRSIVTMEKWRVHTLGRDEPTEIRIDDLVKFQPPTPVGGADISISVEFNPWFIPLRKTIAYRFQTHAEDSGRLFWVPRPLDK